MTKFLVKYICKYILTYIASENWVYTTLQLF